MKRFLLLLTLTLPLISLAQDYVGGDTILIDPECAELELSTVEDETVHRNYQALIRSIQQQRTNARQSSQLEVDVEYVIPVVCNVLYFDQLDLIPGPSGGDYITESRINEIIDYLNEEYSNFGIQFCLTQFDINGDPFDPVRYFDMNAINGMIPGAPAQFVNNTPYSAGDTPSTPEGLAYHPVPGTELSVNPNPGAWQASEPANSFMSAIKTNYSYEPSEHLNIFFIPWGANWPIYPSPFPGAAYAGFGLFPPDISGVFIRTGFGHIVNFIGGLNVISHEVGHYLGLYHTYHKVQGPDITYTSCNDASLETDCFIQGDEVCDTPPQIPWSSCNSGSCLDDSSDWGNTMSKMPCDSGFTQIQGDRMNATLDIFPRNLVAQNGEDLAFNCGYIISDGAIEEGCTDPVACNYDDTAGQDDGSCIFPLQGFDCFGNAIIYGCTNPSACNFNFEAEEDDGSCTFANEGFDCNGDPVGPCGSSSFDFDKDGECDPINDYPDPGVTPWSIPCNDNFDISLVIDFGTNQLITDYRTGSLGSYEYFGPQDMEESTWASKYEIGAQIERTRTIINKFYPYLQSGQANLSIVTEAFDAYNIAVDFTNDYNVLISCLDHWKSELLGIAALTSSRNVAEEQIFAWAREMHRFRHDGAQSYHYELWDDYEDNDDFDYQPITQNNVTYYVRSQESEHSSHLSFYTEYERLYSNRVPTNKKVLYFIGDGHLKFNDRPYLEFDPELNYGLKNCAFWNRDFMFLDDPCLELDELLNGNSQTKAFYFDPVENYISAYYGENNIYMLMWKAKNGLFAGGFPFNQKSGIQWHTGHFQEMLTVYNRIGGRHFNSNNKSGLPKFSPLSLRHAGFTNENSHYYTDNQSFQDWFQEQIVDNWVCYNPETVTTPIEQLCQDPQGNIYNEIGNQCWTDNINISYEGSVLEVLEEDTLGWIKLEEAAYTQRTNEIGYPIVYYNWYAVNQLDLCPSGFHIPTNQDWNNLEEYIFNARPNRPSGQTNMINEDEDVIRILEGYGFFGSEVIQDDPTVSLQGGIRVGIDGTWREIDNSIYYWTTTEYVPKPLEFNRKNAAWARGFKRQSQGNTWTSVDGVTRTRDLWSTSFNKSNGLRVKCVKDISPIENTTVDAKLNYWKIIMSEFETSGLAVSINDLDLNQHPEQYQVSVGKDNLFLEVDFLVDNQLGKTHILTIPNSELRRVLSSQLFSNNFFNPYYSENNNRRTADLLSVKVKKVSSGEQDIVTINPTDKLYEFDQFSTEPRIGWPINHQGGAFSNIFPEPLTNIQNWRGSWEDGNHVEYGIIFNQGDITNLQKDNHWRIMGTTPWLKMEISTANLLASGHLPIAAKGQNDGIHILRFPIEDLEWITTFYSNKYATDAISNWYGYGNIFGWTQPSQPTIEPEVKGLKLIDNNKLRLTTYKENTTGKIQAINMFTGFPDAINSIYDISLGGNRLNSQLSTGLDFLQLMSSNKYNAEVFDTKFYIATENGRQQFNIGAGQLVTDLDYNYNAIYGEDWVTDYLTKETYDFDFSTISNQYNSTLIGDTLIIDDFNPLDSIFGQNYNVDEFFITFECPPDTCFYVHMNQDNSEIRLTQSVASLIPWSTELPNLGTSGLSSEGAEIYTETSSFMTYNTSSKLILNNQQIQGVSAVVQYPESASNDWIKRGDSNLLWPAWHNSDIPTTDASHPAGGRVVTFIIAVQEGHPLSDDLPTFTNVNDLYDVRFVLAEGCEYSLE